MGKKLIKWVAACMIVQAGAFLYLEKVVFSPVASYTQQAVFNEKSLQTLTSPDNTSFAQVSGGIMRVFNHESGYEGEVTVSTEGEVNYFDYYPERGLAVAGITVAKGGGATVVCQEFNMQNKRMKEWRLDNLGKNAKLAETAFPGDSGVIHLLVQDGSASVLYKADFSMGLHKIKTSLSQIDRIVGMNNQEIILLDSRTSGSIYSLKADGKITQVAMPKGRFSLAGVDREDRIYLGQLADKNQVSVLLAGDLSGKFTKVNSFNKTVAASSLRISKEGKVLLNQ